MEVIPGIPAPLAMGCPHAMPSLETNTSYFAGESHCAHVLSNSILSKVWIFPMSTWNHCPGYWVFVMSRQPVQWSPSIALAAEPSISILLLLKTKVASGTEADAVQDFLSSARKLRRVYSGSSRQKIFLLPKSTRDRSFVVFRFSYFP